jgi:hypothetical protein
VADGGGVDAVAAAMVLNRRRAGERKRTGNPVRAGDAPAELSHHARQRTRLGLGRGARPGDVDEVEQVGEPVERRVSGQRDGRIPW